KAKKSRGFLGNPIVMVVGGLLGVAVAGGVLYLVWSKRQPDNAAGQNQGGQDFVVINGPRLRQGDVAETLGPADWKPFPLPDTPSWVCFPSRPAAVTIQGGNQRQEGTVAVFQAVHNNTLYQVTVITPDEPPPPDASPGTILDQMASGLIESA